MSFSLYSCTAAIAAIVGDTRRDLVVENARVAMGVVVLGYVSFVEWDNDGWTQHEHEQVLQLRESQRHEDRLLVLRGCSMEG